jgi:tight adherence protein B
MSGDNIYIFIGLVFVAVFFLAQGMIVPVFGESRQTRKRLQGRLADIEDFEKGGDTMSSIMRAKYLRELSPWEQALESMPFMETLATIIEQAGRKILAYRLVLLSIALALVLAIAAWEYWRIVILAMAAFAVGLMAPFMKISSDRNKRMLKFEEQLPDCIDIIRRAVLAGHPFSTSIRMVSEDMEEPAAKEFGMTFADLNYGNDVRHAMLGLLSRVPSVTVMALVTAILVQKETGGNLAEILDRISSVIRGRFRFQRRIKTLSAEGRMSAWVLAMVPLGLFAFLSINTPEYLPILLDHPDGPTIVATTVVWATIGIYFIRRIIRIEV